MISNLLVIRNFIKVEDDDFSPRSFGDLFELKKQNVETPDTTLQQSLHFEGFDGECLKNIVKFIWQHNEAVLLTILLLFSSRKTSSPVGYRHTICACIVYAKEIIIPIYNLTWSSQTWVSGRVAHPWYEKNQLASAERSLHLQIYIF